MFCGRKTNERRGASHGVKSLVRWASMSVVLSTIKAANLSCVKKYERAHVSLLKKLVPQGAAQQRSFFILLITTLHHHATCNGNSFRAKHQSFPKPAPKSFQNFIDFSCHRVGCSVTISLSVVLATFRGKLEKPNFSIKSREKSFFTILTFEMQFPLNVSFRLCYWCVIRC